MEHHHPSKRIKNIPQREDGSSLTENSFSNVDVAKLTKDVILKQGKKERTARKTLLRTIADSGTFNPTLIVVSTLQEILISNPDRKNETEQLLIDVFNNGVKRDEKVKESIEINIDKGTAQACKLLAERDEKAQKGKITFNTQGSKDYYEWFIYISKQVLQAKSLNKEYLIIELTARTGNVKQEQVDATNQWHINLTETLASISTKTPYLAKDKLKDKLIDLLKSEPTLPGREPIWTNKSADLSLKDIENMTYPLKESDFNKITNFLTSIFEAKSSNTKNLDYKAIAVQRLFANMTRFVNLFEKVEIRNKGLLAIINSWQENFLYRLAYGSSQDTDIINLIKTEKLEIANLMKDMIYMFAEGRPNSTMGTNLLHAEDLTGHPIAEKYLLSRFSTKPFEQQQKEGLKYNEQFSEKFLANVLIPTIKKRAELLGIQDVIGREIEYAEDILKTSPFEKRFSEVINELFKYSAGEDFIDKLKLHKDELEQITETIWQDIYEKGVHFAPLSQGKEEIQFSQDSVAKLLGIKSVGISRLANEDIGVDFSFDNFDFVLHAEVPAKSDHIATPSSINVDYPILYAILDNISAAALHDIFIQKQREESTPRQVPSWWKRIKFKNPFTESTSSPTSHLPRVQSDTDLIRDLYKREHQKIRTVSLHKTHLPFAKKYMAELADYKKAIGSGNLTQEELQQMQNKLTESRDKVYKISKAKLEQIPPRFQLQTVLDPITNDAVNLETWVVEHSSPKPEPEELRSLALLFQRHYRGLSALSFLEQLMPWFVGK